MAVALIMIAGALFFRGPDTTLMEKTPAELLQMLQNGDIVNTQSHPLKVVISGNKNVQYLTGWYKDHTTNDTRHFRTPFSPEWNKPLIDALTKAGIEPVPRPETDELASALISFLPFGLFLFILYFFFRQRIRQQIRRR
jgi:ATP-dependent Zn protease